LVNYQLIVDFLKNEEHKYIVSKVISNKRGIFSIAISKKNKNDLMGCIYGLATLSNCKTITKDLFKEKVTQESKFRASIGKKHIKYLLNYVESAKRNEIYLWEWIDTRFLKKPVPYERRPGESTFFYSFLWTAFEVQRAEDFDLQIYKRALERMHLVPSWQAIRYHPYICHLLPD